MLEKAYRYVSNLLGYVLRSVKVHEKVNVKFSLTYSQFTKLSKLCVLAAVSYINSITLNVIVIQHVAKSVS